MKSNPKELQACDFIYNLPDNVIARWPLEDRSASKMLIYDNGRIRHSTFKHLTKELHPEDKLFLNHTKVIPARLIFQNIHGGSIEIFCLEPNNMTIEKSMAADSTCSWQCLVGGARKWRNQEVLHISSNQKQLSARLLGNTDNRFQVEFSWHGLSSFSEVLNEFGNIPLPPYLKRDAIESDWERYQTVFAKYEGSVAAPTASLHFDKPLLTELQNHGVRICELSLHVGAGTFKPITSPTIQTHAMHAEPFSISLSSIENCITNGRNIAVGTTAMRTLESLYWLGKKILLKGNYDSEALCVGQWDPYSEEFNPPKNEAIQALIEWMKYRQLIYLQASTSLMIAPGYNMQICDGLITNFHQPGSTLILLVAAITSDYWRTIYDTALAGGYRFLSYGDGSLLWINSNV